jgi:hypothetical protein
VTKYIRFFLIFFALLAFFSNPSIANQFKDELFKQKYPYSYFQIARFISCSEGSVEIVPLTNKFSEFAVIARKLDEKCFGKVNRELADFMFRNIENRKDQNSLQPSLYSFDLEFEWKDSEQTKFPYEISKILSPLQLQCGEGCRYATEHLIKVGKDYYFMAYPSDMGVDAMMITDDIVLFEIQMSTHKRNVIFNRAFKELGHFPNGDLEFFDHSIIVRGQKSYLKDVGGAFWYDSKRNFKGEILEFLDVKGGTCIERSKFYQELENKLIAAGKTQLCVFR